MKKVLATSFAFLFILGMAEIGNALSVDLIQGNWTSVSGGTNVTGIGGQEVRWGIPHSSGTGSQSGFMFLGSATPLDFDIDQVVDLGDFTHFNMPINSGTAASGATLAISLNFTDPAGLFGTYNFNFGINETPNNSSPATNPLNNDIISFPNSYASETFYIGGVEYTLQLLGFGPTAEQILTNYSTVETQANTTNLWAKVTAVSPIPEPTTMLLFGTGLAGLAAAGRRREKK
jgi:hypothetical protein